MMHVWCNLVIPAQICVELSCRQDYVYGRTDGRTDIHRQRKHPIQAERPWCKNRQTITFYFESFFFKKLHIYYQSSTSLRGSQPCFIGDSQVMTVNSNVFFWLLVESTLTTPLSRELWMLLVRHLDRFDMAELPPHAPSAGGSFWCESLLDHAIKSNW